MNSIFDDKSSTAPTKADTKSQSSNGLLIIVWTISFLGTIAGGIILFMGMSSAQSAPQEAVIVALAIACAVLPYCFARAISELSRL